MTTSAWVVIVAAGKEEMLGPEIATAFLNLQNQPILSYSLTACEHCPDVENVVIVAPRERLEHVVSIVQLFGCHKIRKIVPGGATQLASFQNGMKYVDENARVVVMHVASCPGVSVKDLTEVTKAAKKHGIAVAGKPITDDIVLTDKSHGVGEYLAAGSVWRYGSPMAFTSTALQKALKAATKKKKSLKTLLEVVVTANQKPTLVETERVINKIGTLEQYRMIERIGLHD